MRCRSGALGAVIVLGGCGGSHAAVRVSVPPPALTGQPGKIRIAGLDGGERVQLRARWRSADGVVWSGGRTVRADGAGQVSVGMEMLAGLRPPRGAFDFFKLPLGRNRIELSVLAGSSKVADATLVRDVQPSSVRARGLTVARDGLAGAYFAPARPRGSAVVLLGGSEGGSQSMRPAAAELAAAGHPCLVLAYFGAPGLPRTLRRVPVETVARGVAWLRRQPPARQRATALLGTSRGGELALLAVSLTPSLAGTVVAIVPGAYVFPGDPSDPAWTHNGRGVTPGQAIPVQSIRGTVLLAGSGNDGQWSSAAFVNDMAETIARHGRAHVIRRIYAGAGHGIGTPIPFTPDVADPSLGGSTTANERAREDLWPRILALL